MLSSTSRLLLAVTLVAAALTAPLVACSADAPSIVPSSSPADNTDPPAETAPGTDGGSGVDGQGPKTNDASPVPGPDSGPDPELPPGPIVDGDGCFVLSASSFAPSGSSEKSFELRGVLGGQGGLLRITLSPQELAAQTYTLGVAPNDPFAQPKHVRVDATAFGTAGGDYRATAGTITLTSLASPATIELAGSASDLKLVEVAYLDGGVVKKPQGKCIAIASAVFDTRVAVGAPCADARDCGTKACDPLTLTCQPPACTTEGPTGNGFYCRSQSSGWHQPKTLYRGCSLAAATSGCADDEECLGASAATPSPLGYCLKRGVHGLDTPCTGTGPGDDTDVFTGCTAGLLCKKFVALEHRCGARCAFFGPPGQCPSAERCQSLYSNAVCAPKPSVVDNAGLDLPCTDTSAALCADDGSAMRGTCVPASLEPDAPRTCRKICRTTADCTGGKTCQSPLGAVLRVCL